MKYILTHQGREYSPRFKKNLRRYINLYNAVVKRLFFYRFLKAIPKSLSKELNEIRIKAREDTELAIIWRPCSLNRLQYGLGLLWNSECEPDRAPLLLSEWQNCAIRFW